MFLIRTFYDVRTVTVFYSLFFLMERENRFFFGVLKSKRGFTQASETLGRAAVRELKAIFYMSYSLDSSKGVI